MTSQPGPLSGRMIAITRAEQQAAEARRLLEALGAGVVDIPALVIGPPDDWRPLDEALSDLESFHWIVFSSACRRAEIVPPTSSQKRSRLQFMCSGP